MTQVVKNHSLVSRFGKQSSHCAAYVPRAAGDQYLHKNAALSETFGLT
jgi:hypothetical protein